MAEVVIFEILPIYLCPFDSPELRKFGIWKYIWDVYPHVLPLFTLRAL